MTTVWSLRNLNFEVQPGEVIGIIGHNGAGKSTLLKILSRITEPTSGRIELYGRVGSLLEVGTGFHPELNGRENIYLNGAILGMKRFEIEKKFDEIVAFSEIEKFLDTPVKHYSSGMYMRLAFAVAAHLEPEILLVDEVLAVGDAAFQRKCLGKINNVAREGRTVIFVSHNMVAVKSLCSRGLFLKNGQLEMDTDIRKAVNNYLSDDSTSGLVAIWEEETAPQSPEFRFIRAGILNDKGEPQVSSIDYQLGFSIVVEYEVKQPLRGLRIGFFIESLDGVPVCGSNHLISFSDEIDGETSQLTEPGIYKSQCNFPGHTLNAGGFSVYFGSDIAPTRNLVTTSFCLTFTVEDKAGHGPLNQKLPGILRPKLQWTIQRIDN